MRSFPLWYTYIRMSGKPRQQIEEHLLSFHGSAAYVMNLPVFWQISLQVPLLLSQTFGSRVRSYLSLSAQVFNHQNQYDRQQCTGADTQQPLHPVKEIESLQ